MKSAKRSFLLPVPMQAVSMCRVLWLMLFMCLLLAPCYIVASFDGNAKNVQVKEKKRTKTEGKEPRRIETADRAEG